MTIGVSGLSDAKRTNGDASDHAYHTFAAIDHHRDELLHLKVLVLEQVGHDRGFVATDPRMAIPTHEMNPRFILFRWNRRIQADGLSLVLALDGVCA